MQSAHNDWMDVLFISALGQDGARPSCDDPEAEIAYEDPSGCDKVSMWFIARI